MSPDNRGLTVIFWLLFCTSIPNDYVTKLKNMQKKGVEIVFPLPASSCLSLLVEAKKPETTFWVDFPHSTLLYSFTDSNINAVWYNIVFDMSLKIPLMQWLQLPITSSTWLPNLVDGEARCNLNWGLRVWVPPRSNNFSLPLWPPFPF